jgi:hypothetical protein
LVACSCLPPGHIANPVIDEEAWGWGAYLLAFLEQGPLQQQLDVSRRTLRTVLLDPTSRGLVQTQLTVFRCPSDSTPALLPSDVRPFGTTAGPDFLPAASSLLGSCGLFDRDCPNPNNGVLYGNSGVTFADISDGTSNTFVIGERDQRCGASACAACRRRRTTLGPGRISRTEASASR